MYVYIYVCIYMYIYYIYIPKATSAPPRAGTTGNLIQLTCKLIKLKTCLVLTFTALIFSFFPPFPSKRNQINLNPTFPDTIQDLRKKLHLTEGRAQKEDLRTKTGKKKSSKGGSRSGRR